MRCFAMVLVALLMAGGPAVGHEVDPAVIAMFRQWSITPPSPSGVFICHGFGCDFRTEIGLAGSDRAQMSAIMASGSASAEAQRVAIGRSSRYLAARKVEGGRMKPKISAISTYRRYSPALEGEADA